MGIIVVNGANCKQCAHCGNTKTTDEFKVHKSRRDGFSPYCVPCTNELRHAEYARNIDKYRQQRTDNSERARLYAVAYYAENASSVRRKNAEYRKRNPEIHATHKANRRAQKVANGGKFSMAEWKALKAEYNHICLMCWRAEPDIKLTPDHVVPLSRGGANHIGNIQPLCYSCNSSKNDKTIDFRVIWSANVCH